MKKAIYKPTNQNTIIINQLEGYCEVLLDGEFKTVSINDLILETSQITLATLNELKENIFINCIKKPLSDILYSYNSNKVTPEPHQYKPLIKFLNSENSRLLIADEVGLGKTIEAGMIFKEINRREELRISLIVVPSSLTLKWKEEFNLRFDEHFEIYKSSQFLNFIDEFENYNGSKLFNEKIIISYHTLRDERVIKKLQDSFFEVDFLIMDEAHTMRNYDTSTFKGGEIITAKSEHIIFLTATPVQNSLLDLFNILSLLDNDYFRDFDYFQKMIEPNKTIHKLIALIRNNHNLKKIQSFISENLKESYPLELKEIFSDIAKLQEEIPRHKKIEFIDRLTQSDHLSFIINRSKKKDIGRSIPRSAKSVIVEIREEEQAYYDAVIAFVKYIYPHVPQGFITIMPERMVSSSMLASLESFKKLKKSGRLLVSDLDDLDEDYDDFKIESEAMGYLDDIIYKGNQIGEYDSKFLSFEEILKDLDAQNIKQKIVFSFFKKTLNYLEKKLQNLGYKVGKIYGDFNTEERFTKIKAFKKGEFDILLSSEVGSEGLDMQFCNVVINYDLPWNPMRVEQRIGRIDRIGQKFDKLHIFNLCIVGSIEDRIYNRLYTKLDIFENSIGELEPILGNLEKQLDIPKLIHLSAEEVEKKIHLNELALERQKSEIKKQNSEMEKLINDDFNYQLKEDIFLNDNKISLLQEESKKLFVKFLKNNHINFLELKDGIIKLSSENIKRLFNLLKKNMSNKRTNALAYKEERRVLQKIYKLKELKVTFKTNNNDDFHTLHLYLNHPIIKIIIRNKNQKIPHCMIFHSKYNNGFALIYRADFRQLKDKSIIRVLVVDSSLALVEELDYFEFITKCSPIEAKPTKSVETLKEKLTPKMIEFIEKYRHIESISQNRLIDIKIDSIKNYFKKQIKRTKRLQKKVKQEGIQRMRIGEIENLKRQRDIKIRELMEQKDGSFEFEILGVLEIGGDYE